MSNSYVLISIIISAFVTLLLRAVPFIVFGGSDNTPKTIKALGEVLPFAIMGMLVVYCLKDIHFTSAAGFLPQLIAGAVASLLYVWKKSALISIVSSTVLYMVLIQNVF